MPHARPAADLADLKSREPGTRLLLPPLSIISVTMRYARFKGVEVSVYDYRFTCDDEWLWEIEYSGSYKHGWDSAHGLRIVATIHRHSQRFRCTRIKRPVVSHLEDVPLFMPTAIGVRTDGLN